MTLAEMIDHINWVLPLIIPLCILALGLRYALKILNAGDLDNDGYE